MYCVESSTPIFILLYFKRKPSVYRMSYTAEKRAWINVLNTLLGELTLVLLVSVGVVLLHDHFKLKWIFISALPLQVFGIALSIFLAFLNNTAYDRWWEGRVLWGIILNQCRTFARQTSTLIQASENADLEACRLLKRELICRQIAYAAALRDHLRDVAATRLLEEHLNPSELKTLEKEQNLPLALLQIQGEKLQEAHRQGWLTELAHMNFDGTLTELTNAQGGCERLKNTPIPSPYRVFSHNLVFFFCCAIPFGLVASVGAKTIVVATLTALGFLMLERAGSLLAEPFRPDANGLPLDRIVETVRENLTQRIETKL